LRASGWPMAHWWPNDGYIFCVMPQKAHNEVRHSIENNYMA
jgi:hypothetical protein